MKYFIIIITFVFSSQLLALEAPYLVYLPAGSTIISVNTQKEIITKQGITLYAREENSTDKMIYGLYNKNKEKVYLTSALNIHELDSYIHLLPPAVENIEYSKRKIVQTADRDLNLQSIFMIHLEQVSMSELKALYPAQSGTAHSIRYEARTLYASQLPIQFGLNLNYQNIYWPNGTEKVNLSILGFGPSFNYQFFRTANFTLSFLTSAEFAPLAESRSSLNIHNFYASAFDLGLEAELPSKYGILAIGTHYRTNLLLLKNSKNTNPVSVQNEYDLSSLGLSLGYKVDWDL